MAKQKEIAGRFFLKDDTLFPAKEFSEHFLKTGINVYEVIRVISSTPLFLEDHCKRFSNSLKGKGVEFDCAAPKLKYNLEKLINENKLVTGNIKIVFHFQPAEKSFLIIYPVQHVYPSKDDYKFGVFTVSFEEERPDPEFKNWRPDFKARVKKLKKETGAYEIILVTHDGIITEGSQSNLFFLKGDKVITAMSERILPGITRKYVYEICKNLEIEIIERDFALKDLENYDSAFISGTSPKILPLNQIDEFRFDPVHPVLRRIMEEYEGDIREYLYNYKRMRLSQKSERN
ncbi:MAG: aminotransferase class IV [Bacteroidales bacterium]